MSHFSDRNCVGNLRCRKKETTPFFKGNDHNELANVTAYLLRPTLTFFLSNIEEYGKAASECQDKAGDPSTVHFAQQGTDS